VRASIGTRASGQVAAIASGRSFNPSRHRASAEAALIEATGGTPICRLDGAGAHLEDRKFAEGRLAAVIELQHALRNAREPDDGAVSRDLLAAWENEQQVAQGRGGAWVAYRSGGVSELRAIVGELEAGVSH
jgi:hypothetical protein